MNDMNDKRDLESANQSAQEKRSDIYDTQADQNIEESRRKNSQELGEEGKASAKETENHETKVKNTASEESIAQKEIESDKITDAPMAEELPKQQYSCSFTPPYYAPNFSSTAPKTKSKEATNKKGWGILAATLALCLILSFCVGGYAGFVAATYSHKDTPQTDDSVTIIKNDGSIKVNEQVGSTGYSDLGVSDVVNLVADNVVEITTSQVQTDPFYGQYVTSGAGSGVIFTSNGYIMTNNHVIEGADEIYVRLTDGTEYVAECLGGDADYDIAVLKINANQKFASIALGSSADLIVGEEVVAIGNPLGQLGGTVTNGIISALDRNVTVDGHQMTLLQTNAAINPGNSGGGLFNMAGELIGIVNAKQSDTGIEGLGFAIPIDVAYRAAKDIMEHGYVTGKPSFGFEVEESLKDFSIPNGWNFISYPAGVYIVETTNTNLEVYDRVVSINGISINSISDYYAAVNELKIGDTMNITVSRWGGMSFKEHKVSITVAEYVPKLS